MKPLAVAPAGPPRPRLLAVTALAAATTLVLAVAGIVAGSSGLSVPDTVRTVFVGGDASESFIVFQLRLPRVCAAVLVGASLGMAGALTQSFSRNPLATPDIIGVTAGASAGAVFAIVAVGGTYAVSAGVLSLGVPVMATVSGLATAALVYSLSWSGGVDSYRLILIGIGASATLTGLTSYLLVRAELSLAQAATQWLVGSLSGVSWLSVWPTLVTFVVLTPIALTQTGSLDVVQLGDEVATGLGVDVQWHRLVVLASAAILTSVAVSASGPIGFVAFVAPQVARRLGRTSRPPLIASALLGAITVCGADVLGRAVLPWTVPVGIITALVGAPYLIWLLARGNAWERTS
ncbi:MAG TPA: iron ABC transporter permease [Ornithinimicrobium sp.]|uniref:FecCD family ABC transporter permease n=1 Tax=Ornithinimicrobium sp. TaxID=1977084 RepID=UPI002B48242D|nr:iron ABC transporter permease [Ornithinimicrobium sp.]HKJ10879.1 iron ABC transporter permease [Ornithinimicrobium sp.]